MPHKALLRRCVPTLNRKGLACPEQIVLGAGRHCSGAGSRCPGLAGGRTDRSCQSQALPWRKFNILSCAFQSIHLSSGDGENNRERNSHFPSFFISPVMVWPFKIVVSSLWSHGTTFKLKGGQMQQGHGYKSSSSCSGMVSTREQRPGPRPQRHRLRECRQWIYQSIGPKTVRKPTCSFPWQMGSKGE